MELSTPPNLKGSKVAVLGSSLERGLGSYPQLGEGQVSQNCARRIHETERKRA